MKTSHSPHAHLLASSQWKSLVLGLALLGFSGLGQGVLAAVGDVNAINLDDCYVQEEALGQGAVAVGANFTCYIPNGTDANGNAQKTAQTLTRKGPAGNGSAQQGTCSATDKSKVMCIPAASGCGTNTTLNPNPNTYTNASAACQAAVCLSPSATKGCVPATSDVLAQKPASETATPDKIGGITFPKTELPDPPKGVRGILENLFQWLLMIFGFLSVGAFVFSGIQYLISAGSDDMIKTAKRNMTWSMVGVLVGFSGYVIVRVISSALSASSLVF